MKFSVCIPNYNYGHYIGETIRSALNQSVCVEVLVSDNCSTDNSVSVVEGICDDRVRLRRNLWNVGFSGNLDLACRGATGARMLLLSSDDVAGPGALMAYQRLAEALGSAAERAVFCSSSYVIDAGGRVLGLQRHDIRQWADAKEDESLSGILQERVMRVSARALLARSLAHLRNPFSFATTCYPRALYEAVEGYGGGMLINPDKTFAWKLLSIADEVLYIDSPLFSYRVHNANQTAQQQESGALKHLLDQYRATFDTPPAVLMAAGIKRADLAYTFVEHDVALRGLNAVANGERHLARRHLAFGRATYPAIVARSHRTWMLRAALALGPLGTWIAKNRRDSALNAYRAGGFIDNAPISSRHG